MENVDLILPLAVFLATVVLVITVSRGVLGGRDVLRKRLERYTSDAEPHWASPVEAGSRSILRQRQLSRFQVVQSVLSGSSYAERVAAELEAAAVPLRVGEYLLLRLVCAAILMLPVPILGIWPPVALPLGLAGFFAPRVQIARRKQQRLKQFNDSLVDALTMMSNALRSGSSFLQAIDMVSRELTPPLSEEFGRVVAEVGIGTGVDVALTNLSRRVRSYDLYLTVTAIQIQRQTGGNLAEVLSNIAYTIRERIKLLRQVEVLTAQERMSGLVVGLLPIVALVGFSIISPGYTKPFIETEIGHYMLAAAFVLEVVGFVAMNRLSKIDV